MSSHDQCAFCIHRGFSSPVHLRTTNATSAFVVATKDTPRDWCIAQTLVSFVKSVPQIELWPRRPWRTDQAEGPES